MCISQPPRTMSTKQSANSSYVSVGGLANQGDLNPDPKQSQDRKRDHSTASASPLQSIEALPAETQGNGVEVVGSQVHRTKLCYIFGLVFESVKLQHPVPSSMPV